MAGLELDIYFPPPSSRGPNNLPAGEAMVNEFPLRADLIKNRVLRHISKWLLLFPQPRSIMRFHYLLWDSDQAPKRKSQLFRGGGLIMTSFLDFNPQTFPQ